MAEKELTEEQSGVVVFIPAFKKSSFFQDDLLRKLDGVPLIQRAINKALTLGIEQTAVHVLTDSEEVHLLATRSFIGTFFDAGSGWSAQALGKEGRAYIDHAENGRYCSVVLSVYAPLLQVSTLQRGISKLKSIDAMVLQPVRLEQRSLYDGGPKVVSDLVFSRNCQDHYLESHAFSILRSGLLGQKCDEQTPVAQLSVGDDALEIDSLRSWWVCEKLLQRRRIVFRVIGNVAVGAGHIYRSLSLAHEMTDHEVLFVTDHDNDIAARKLVDSEYWTAIYPKGELLDGVIELSPDLVVFDILNSDSGEVKRLRDNGIRIVSFEDLGPGSKFTNLTINELYDEPQLVGENYRWGQEYFFVRDEFSSATPAPFRDSVQGLLLTFGGTDQHDLSRKIFFAVREICARKGVHIHIVTGPGYRDFLNLQREIGLSKGVTLTHATGVISGVMEQCDIAITSNGRTVYELAHMNIPAIAIDQHERENTHHFARRENGFVPLGVYSAGKTELLVKQELRILLDDQIVRRSLYKSAERHSFLSAKERVAEALVALATDAKAGKSI